MVPRRSETHVKTSVLALQRKRVAEISCGISWHRISLKNEIQRAYDHLGHFLSQTGIY
jgi:hypothetical protein